MARVLVVDDDELMRRMIRESLERAGHSVEVAGDGRKAMCQLAQGVPDVMILDLIMPDQEGIETIIQMRKTFPGLPVIAISGGGRRSPKDYLVIAKQLGAKETFAKPFALSDVLEAIDRLTAAAE